jgi:tetratricopeptide (TPR) repeat protein
MQSRLAFIICSCVALLPVVGPVSGLAQSSVQQNNNQVKTLNAFADELLAVVAYWDSASGVKTTKRIGGYSGRPDYYVEAEYSDSATGHVLARVRWTKEQPDTAQMIEVFFRDKHGRLVADYFVSYLVGHRNAPMHALINLHQGDADLQAFRQFDIFGEKLFERCQGHFFGNEIDISIDSYDPDFSPTDVSPDLYTSCFGFLPLTPGKYIHPARQLAGLKPNSNQREEIDDFARAEALIAELDSKIAENPDDEISYVKRGNTYFLVRRMAEAAEDFSRALKLNPELDAAYYGRGMALGRIGRLEESIADLTQFINRNPESSLGYTKRGVRKIWNKDFDGAIADLKMAVSFDDRNAEAHDDLGVALAQTGDHDGAVGHFQKARSIDPTYQKAHHNLATVLYLVGNASNALSAVDKALDLAPHNRDSLLLKGAILEGLGHLAEAKKFRDRAEFLPEGNWSERSAIR